MGALLLVLFAAAAASLHEGVAAVAPPTSPKCAGRFDVLCRGSSEACLVCTGRHQRELRGAGCNQEELVALCAAGTSVSVARLLWPENGAVLFCAPSGATPRFSWDAGPVPTAVAGLPDTVIEISSSPDFGAAVFLERDSVPAILSRYVRADPLPLMPKAKRSVYYWRIGLQSTGATHMHHESNIVWSTVSSFEVRVPAKSATIPSAETDWITIQSVFNAAADSHEPYLVSFEMANRTLVPPSVPDRHFGTRSIVTGANNIRSQGANPTAFIRMTSVTNVIIDGGGSRLTFADYIQFVDLLNCSNVEVMNFEFDLAPLPYTALVIDSVDTTTSSATMTLQPDHPTVEALLSDKQLETSGIAEVMDQALSDDEMPVTMRGVPEVIYFSNVTRLPSDNSNPRYQMVLKWGGTNPHLPQLHGVERLSPGNVIVIDPRIDIGFDVMGGENVTLRNMHVYACANECFNSEHAESLAILRCGTKLAPGRYLAANNGGHNHHGAAVGQWVESGIWENAGDDTIHVSGLVMSVLAGGQTDPSITLAPSYPDSYAIRKPVFHHSLGVRNGDLLEFYDFNSGDLIARRTVIEMTDATDHNPTVDVILDEPVGSKLVLGRIGGGPLNHSVTQVFNFNRTSNQFVFRKNTVRNGRRVGVLFKGFRSWIDSNVFVGLGGGALELWNAPYEGLFAETVLFRNNTVRDVCQLSRGAAPIWTSVPRPQSATTPANVHADLRIEGNVFDTGPGPTFWLMDIHNVVITANNVSYCSKAVVYPSGGVLNMSSNTGNVVFRPDSNVLHASELPRLCLK